MSEAEMRAAVERGAKLLDEKKPGWEEHIKPERLDMGSCSQCVLGQALGDYVDGREAIGGIFAGTAWSTEHGFAVVGLTMEGYPRLLQLWLEQIERRLRCKAK